MRQLSVSIRLIFSAIFTTVFLFAIAFIDSNAHLGIPAIPIIMAIGTLLALRIIFNPRA